MNKKQLQMLAIVIAKWSDDQLDVYRLATHFDYELPETGVKRSDFYFRIEATKIYKELQRLKG